MGNYRKTSAEELTAMANQLREIGDFTEGQKFVFPSSEYDENPIYTFKIVESGVWSEITRAEADELVEQGYDTQEVEEFPAVGEAVANTVYFTVQRQLGFAEAYQKTIDEFYQKVYHGTLTQEDVDGVVFDGSQIRLFRHLVGNPVQTYLDIKNISITPSFLNYVGNCRRLHNIETVNVVNPDNQDITIKDNKFHGCPNLRTINCAPISIESESFSNCISLILGNDSLLLDNCLTIGTSAFFCCNFDEISLLNCTSIGDSAFKRPDTCSQLEKVYLPAIPPDLQNVNAFYYYYYQGGHAVYKINPTLKFYVPNGAKTNYASATNWSGFIDGTLDNIDHFEELGGGN